MVLELPSRRPKRADARRNFDALVAAARDAFADQGAHVSLEDVARRAGVSIATLYRNFPTREDLVEEVHRDEVEALCRAADDVADLEPWEAFAAWLERFAEYIGTKQAFSEALNRTTEGFQACRRAMREAGEPLLRRAQEAGAARPEATIDDVLRLISGVCAVEYVDEAQRRRVFGFALAGLRGR
ncbi:MAG TPA: helix-turn-helix domain-containing protein [Amycolatopsis sp.]|uniref:TetR/AcrR family transcriptional regulator n=1 Tax=Amycolatopsis sp. TaxID=37632 RepID=UPI002F3EFA48